MKIDYKSNSYHITFLYYIILYCIYFKAKTEKKKSQLDFKLESNFVSHFHITF